MTLKNLALVTCFAILASLPIPMWQAAEAMLATPSRLAFPAIFLACLLSAILPAFYFALYRNGATFPLTHGLRRWSLVGAVAGALVVVGGLPEWLDASRPGFTTAKMLLSDIANLACISFLIMLYRGKAASMPAAPPASKLFRFMIKLAVVAGSLWFAFNLLSLVMTPYAYRALANRAAQTGSAMQRTEADMIRGALRTVLEQICLFTAPFLAAASLPATCGPAGESKT